jgi:hypothetical protein
VIKQRVKSQKMIVKSLEESENGEVRIGVHDAHDAW